MNKFKFSLINIKDLFSHRISILSLILMCLWMFTDINNRLNQTITSKSNSNKHSEVHSLILPQLPQNTLTQLAESFKKYKLAQEPEADVEQGLTKEELEKQAGTLTQVFTGNNKLSLKAVIQSKPPIKNKKINLTAKKYALIEVTDLKSNSSEIIKYVNGSELFGYKLIIKYNTQVELMSDNQANLNNITLLMYQGVKPRPNNKITSQIGSESKTNNLKTNIKAME